MDTKFGFDEYEAKQDSDYGNELENFKLPIYGATQGRSTCAYRRLKSTGVLHVRRMDDLEFLKLSLVSFQVLTVASTKMTVFW
jgi:hypothetical protein